MSDDDDEIEEELGFISPLDTVNPYTSFKQALTSCVISFLFHTPQADNDDLGVLLSYSFPNAEQLGVSSIYDNPWY